MAFGIQTAQRHRKRALFIYGILAAGILAVTAEPKSVAERWSLAVQLASVAFIAVSVAGRAWCTAVIGRRKKVHLVTDGPFSISRNPLYVFSVVGAFGVGLASESVGTAVLLASIIFLVHDQIIRYEEKFLRDRFGGAFDTYCETTPRWLSWRPRWRPANNLEYFDLELVLRRAGETMLLFLAIPFFEGVEYFHNKGVFPVLIYIP